MTVVVVGSGGREHALAWKLASSSRTGRLGVAPGNAGMPAAWERWPLGGAQDFEAFARRARNERVDLVVVGPDQPLADGLVDILNEHGVLTFGPSRGAAQIEASKAFAKEVMQAAGVPTAQYGVAHSLEQAIQLLQSFPAEQPCPVIKADGLALGKGVRICQSRDEAIQASRELILVSGRLVIEERLFGEEISWMAFCDGDRCALLEPARDYKRLQNGDQGPNTGGMGAFSPVPGIPAAWTERVRQEIFLPTLREMKKRGHSFRGLLYAGLMVDVARDRFWVIEFNSRFGDPEAQVLLPRIEGDLYPWLEACARGDLTGLPSRVPFKKDAAVYVVGAARGYPEKPEKGQLVEGPSENSIEETSVFFAGVAASSQGLVTSGGRVLGALGLGSSLKEARTQAYSRLGRVGFEGMQFRSDIALRESAQEGA